MEVFNSKEKEGKKIESFPYRGKPLPVKDVKIQWLTQAGPEDSPEYGLRFFTVGPGGEIPIHNHFYMMERRTRRKRRKSWGPMMWSLSRAWNPTAPKMRVIRMVPLSCVA
jgi:hypothetical protein